MANQPLIVAKYEPLSRRGAVRVRARIDKTETLMNEKTWFENLPAAVTVTDAEGVIVAMNECAVATFAKYGGQELVGRNLLDVHSPASREKVAALFRDRRPNTYAIDKNGVRKIIHQTPWFENGEFRGLAEISFAIPADLPVQKRE